VSDVSDLRVLVTGGTSGLGWVISAALIAGGAQAALTGRDPTRAAVAAADIGAAGPGRAVGVAWPRLRHIPRLQLPADFPGLR
jgi:NAD(P)-dependent dehydrogenase (short-subunit alcohol dehydrogenase family)